MLPAIALIAVPQGSIVGWQNRHLAAKPPDRLAMGFQLRRPHAAFFSLLCLFDDPKPPGLGAGTGPGDKAAKRQRGLLGVVQAFGHYRSPQGQHRGSVHADR